jgi:hypothetical protein
MILDIPAGLNMARRAFCKRGVKRGQRKGDMIVERERERERLRDWKMLCSWL